MGDRWRVPTTLIVIYKYIKYAIKIVNSFPLHLLHKLLLEECSLSPDTLKRFFSNHYENGKCLCAVPSPPLKSSSQLNPGYMPSAILISSVYTF